MQVKVCSVHQVNKAQRSCVNCGGYCQEESHVSGVKTQRFIDPFLLNSRGFLKCLQRRAANFVTLQELPLLNPMVSDILGQLANFFNLSLTTLAKGLYMFYHLLNKHPQFEDQQLRYGAVCLYLSAKMTECLSGIPNVGVFGHQAYKVFESQQYAALEEEVFGCLQKSIFNVVFFTEFLEFYQVKGIVLNNETNTQRILQEAETKIRTQTSNYIRSGEFLQHPQEKLAAFILHQTRQTLKVSEIWNEHIEFYTNIGTLEIYNIMNECRKKMVSDVITNKRIVAKHSASISKNSPNTSTSSSSMQDKYIPVQSPAIVRMNTILRSASVKNKLLARPFRGVTLLI